MNLPQTLAMTVLRTSGGGVKYAWRKVSRGKYIELLSTPTSLKDDCKRGKHNGLVATPTSLKDDCKKGKCIELGSTFTGLEGRCKVC